MTSGSYASKGWWKRSLIPVATGFSPTATRSAWSSSNCMKKIYAPLTAGILRPFAADQDIPQEKITTLDRRYSAVIQALDDLVDAVGLKAA